MNHFDVEFRRLRRRWRRNLALCQGLTASAHVACKQRLTGAKAAKPTAQGRGRCLSAIRITAWQFRFEKGYHRWLGAADRAFLQIKVTWPPTGDSER